MNGHPIEEADLDLYALGALEGEERRAVESHLAACSECERNFENARGRIALLALAAPPNAPPPALKVRVMQQLHARPLARRARIATEEQPPVWRPFTGLRAMWVVAAAVLACATIFLWVENNRLARDLSALRTTVQRLESEAARNRALDDLLEAPDTIPVTLSSSSGKSQPQGRVLYNARRGLLSYTGNLPPLPADKTYQLWLVPTSGNPVNAGIFNPGPSGEPIVMLSSMPVGVTAKAFAVTVEPAGGKPQPTGSKVLIGPVS